MRLHIGHPNIAAPQPGGSHQHHRYDELMLLTFMMMAPVIAALPPIQFRFLFHSFLWALLGSIIGGFVMTAVFLAYVVLSWPKARKVQPMRAVAFNPDLLPKERLDTIVIGSGSGGSTCSNLLAQSGQRVLVLEQHPTVTGGCTHSFREKNCEWDTGTFNSL